MDELQISGKRFISSRRIARENGYTSDYIGQLIRGGKITGTKVGRAWYVEARSFDAYLGGEGAAATVQAPAPVAAAAASKSEPEPEVDAPAVEEAPIKVPVAESKPFAHVIDEVPVVADEELLPAVEEIKIAAVEEASKPKAAEVVRQEIPESAVETRIPLHVYSKPRIEEPLMAQPGLRYVVDDEPNLPEISRSKKESRVEEREVSDVRTAHGAFEPVQRRGIKTAQIGALAAVALAIFAISALVSSALSLNLSIEAGNTATAAYSFEK